jgi:uncharacterized protein
MRKSLALLILLATQLISPVYAGSYEDALLAARDGRTDEIAALLKRGLDANTADPKGTTLLGLATQVGDLKTVELLLAHRASPNRRNAYGDTPILFAAHQGRLDLVKRLHSAGADLEPAGWTVLHYAVMGGHEPIVRYALEQGARVNQRAPNQQTALMLSAYSGLTDIAKLLVEKGAATGMLDAEKRSAAQLAAEKEFSGLANYLKSLPLTLDAPAATAATAETASAAASSPVIAPAP